MRSVSPQGPENLELKESQLGLHALSEKRPLWPVPRIGVILDLVFLDAVCLAPSSPVNPGIKREDGRNLAQELSSL